MVGDCSKPNRATQKVETVSSSFTILTYLLTYSMMQSPSWEANWFAASQEITRISPNPKVHYRTHKRPPPVSILGQPNPVHIPTSHLLEIHPNIIHPSTPRYPQWSSSLRFPHQDPIHPLSSPIRATFPAHLILLDVITRTIHHTLLKPTGIPSSHLQRPWRHEDWHQVQICRYFTTRIQRLTVHQI